jgi:hypothetical protein
MVMHTNFILDLDFYIHQYNVTLNSPYCKMQIKTWNQLIVGFVIDYIPCFNKVSFFIKVSGFVSWGYNLWHCI